MRVTLWRNDVRLHAVVTSAAQRHDSRVRVFLRLEHDGFDGYGEVAPQPTALNGDPGVDDVLAELLERVLPQVARAVASEGDLPSWTRIGRFAGSRASSGAAVALVEMAVLERAMQRDHARIGSLWPALYETPRQSGVSLMDDGTWAIDDDVVRLRVKTAPGALDGDGLARLSAVRQPVLLDFNCSARCDEDVIDQVRALEGTCDVVAVEQPYAPGNVADTARLAAQLGVAVSVDEGVRSMRDLTQLVRYGAASMVCVKPARVGGVANARTMIATARSLGLAPYVGGFFESPYARTVHRHLAVATTPEPGDVANVPVEGGLAEVEPCDWAFGVRPSRAVLDGAELVYADPEGI